MRANELILTTNRELIDFIGLKGFRHNFVNSRKRYFSNKEGKQLRIDFDHKELALIDKAGYTKYFFTGKFSADALIEQLSKL